MNDLGGKQIALKQKQVLVPNCCGLERVSITHLGRTYLDNKGDLNLFGDDKDNDEDEEWITKMISQTATIKFVRFMPTLCWL
jgi:hypothetical protein